MYFYFVGLMENESANENGYVDDDEGVNVDADAENVDVADFEYRVVFV